MNATIGDYVLNKARVNLSNFVISKAGRLARDLGFSYIETDSAPESFEDLEAAFKHSMQTRAPLPVYMGASEDTIYTSMEANWAFRFWHDVIHASNGYRFTLEDEAKCSLKQAECIANYFGKNSDEYRLFIADTIGQSVYAEIHGGLFPDNQLSYVKSILRSY